jgi:chromosome segregation ATPase
MHPAVVERAVAHAERSILRQGSAGEREALEAELKDVKQAMRRLRAAIAKGGELDSLVAGLETHERERAELESKLEALRAAADHRPRHSAAAADGVLGRLAEAAARAHGAA